MNAATATAPHAAGNNLNSGSSSNNTNSNSSTSSGYGSTTTTPLTNYDTPQHASTATATTTDATPPPPPQLPPPVSQTVATVAPYAYSSESVLSAAAAEIQQRHHYQYTAASPYGYQPHSTTSTTHAYPSTLQQHDVYAGLSYAQHHAAAFDYHSSNNDLALKERLLYSSNNHNSNSNTAPAAHSPIEKLAAYANLNATPPQHAATSAAANMAYKHATAAPISTSAANDAVTTNVPPTKPQATATPFYAAPRPTAPTTYYEQYKLKMPTTAASDYSNYACRVPPNTASSYQQQQQQYYAAVKSQLSQSEATYAASAATKSLSPTAPGVARQQMSSYYARPNLYYDKYDKYAAAYAPPPNATTTNPTTYPATHPPPPSHFVAETTPPPESYRKSAIAPPPPASSWHWNMDYTATATTGNCRTLPPPPAAIPTAAVPPSNAAGSSYLSPGSGGRSALSAPRDAYYNSSSSSSKYDKYSAYAYHQQQQQQASTVSPARTMWSAATPTTLSERLPHTTTHLSHQALPPPPYSPHHFSTQTRQNCCSQSPYQHPQQQQPPPQSCYFPRLPPQHVASNAAYAPHHSHHLQQQLTPQHYGSNKYAGNIYTDYPQNKLKYANDLMVAAATSPYDAPTYAGYNYAQRYQHAAQQQQHNAANDAAAAAYYYNDLNLQSTAYEGYATTVQQQQQHHHQQPQQRAHQHLGYHQQPPSAQYIKNPLLDYRKPSGAPSAPLATPVVPTAADAEYFMHESVNVAPNYHNFDSVYDVSGSDSAADKLSAANKNLSLRDFLATWNDDEDDAAAAATDINHYIDPAIAVADADNHVKVLQAETKAALPGHYMHDAAKLPKQVHLQEHVADPALPTHLLEHSDDQQLRDDINDARPKLHVGIAVDGNMDAQYINLPDIVIDIEKSTNVATTNFENFDVEKELDELQIKKSKFGNEQPPLLTPPEQHGAVNSNALSVAAETRNIVPKEAHNFKGLLLENKQQQNHVTETSSLLSKPAVSEDISCKTLPISVDAEHAVTCVATATEQLLKEIECDNTSLSNESTFEKEYETFINKIDGDVEAHSGEKFRAASVIKLAAAATVEDLSNTEMLQHEVATNNERLAIEKNDEAAETEQQIYSKFNKRKRKLLDNMSNRDEKQQLQQQSKRSDSAEKITPSEQNFPLVYTKICRKRKILAADNLAPTTCGRFDANKFGKRERRPQIVVKSKTYLGRRRKPKSFYYKMLHQSGIKNMHTSLRLQQYVAKLRERHLPLIKRQSIKRYAAANNRQATAFNPQSLKRLSVSILNTEHFRQHLLGMLMGTELMLPQIVAKKFDIRKIVADEIDIRKSVARDLMTTAKGGIDKHDVERHENINNVSDKEDATHGNEEESLHTFQCLGGASNIKELFGVHEENDAAEFELPSSNFEQSYGELAASKEIAKALCADDIMAADENLDDVQQYDIQKKELQRHDAAIPKTEDKSKVVNNKNEIITARECANYNKKHKYAENDINQSDITNYELYKCKNKIDEYDVVENDITTNLKRSKLMKSVDAIQTHDEQFVEQIEREHKVCENTENIDERLSVENAENEDIGHADDVNAESFDQTNVNVNDENVDTNTDNNIHSTVADNGENFEQSHADANKEKHVDKNERNSTPEIKSEIKSVVFNVNNTEDNSEETSAEVATCVARHIVDDEKDASEIVDDHDSCEDDKSCDNDEGSFADKSCKIGKWIDHNADTNGTSTVLRQNFCVYNAPNISTLAQDVASTLSSIHLSSNAFQENEDQSNPTDNLHEKLPVIENELQAKITLETQSESQKYEIENKTVEMNEIVQQDERHNDVINDGTDEIIAKEKLNVLQNNEVERACDQFASMNNEIQLIKDFADITTNELQQREVFDHEKNTSNMDEIKEYHTSLDLVNNATKEKMLEFENNGSNLENFIKSAEDSVQMVEVMLPEQAVQEHEQQASNQVSTNDLLENEIPVVTKLEASENLTNDLLNTWQGDIAVDASSCVDPPGNSISSLKIKNRNSVLLDEITSSSSSSSSSSSTSDSSSTTSDDTTNSSSTTTTTTSSEESCEAISEMAALERELSTQYEVAKTNDVGTLKINEKSIEWQIGDHDVVNYDINIKQQIKTNDIASLKKDLEGEEDEEDEDEDLEEASGKCCVESNKKIENSALTPDTLQMVAQKVEKPITRNEVEEMLLAAFENAVKEASVLDRLEGDVELTLPCMNMAINAETIHSPIPIVADDEETNQVDENFTIPKLSDLCKNALNSSCKKSESMTCSEAFKQQHEAQVVTNNVDRVFQLDGVNIVQHFGDENVADSVEGVFNQDVGNLSQQHGDDAPVHYLNHEDLAEPNQTCELSVEEALAEMYRQVGVASDPEDYDADDENNDKQAQEVLLINLEEILVSDSDNLYVLQCDMNENILGVITTQTVGESSEVDDVAADNDVVNESVEHTLELVELLNASDDIQTIDNAINQTNDFSSSITFQQLSPTSPATPANDVMPSASISTIFTTTTNTTNINTKLLPPASDHVDDASFYDDDDFDLPTIHHEEIVPENYKNYQKEKFLKYLHAKYVQQNINKFYHSNRIIKKYKKRLVQKLLNAMEEQRVDKQCCQR